MDISFMVYWNEAVGRGRTGVYTSDKQMNNIFLKTGSDIQPLAALLYFVGKLLDGI